MRRRAFIVAASKLKRKTIRLVLAACAACSPATQALAHAGERGFVLLMPTEHYIAGGVAAVAISFLGLTLAPDRPLRRLFARRWAWRGRAPTVVLESALSWASFLVLMALIWVGLHGSRDPTINLAPLTIWTLWWVGFVVMTALVGDLWRFLNPWTGPYRALRWATGGGDPPFRLPGAAGCWPAVVWFFGFSWFLIASLAPSDPTGLAQAAGLYWGATFLGMLAFGERGWLSRGECFSILFSHLARLSPVSGGSNGMVIAPPGATLIQAPPLSLSGAVLVLGFLATVTVDGLRETFWWLAQIGVNPLAFPGRSAVIIENTLGLLLGWAALAGAFFGAVWLGARMVGEGARAAEIAGRLALSLIPIALGYHVAHYLTALLVDGQYALVALSDPLGRGDDWLGLGEFYVTTSFFFDPASVEAIWRTQAGAVALGHLFAVVLSHVIALEAFGDARRAAIAQIPLAVLMVVYTWLGLWLLATPVV